MFEKIIKRLSTANAYNTPYHNQRFLNCKLFFQNYTAFCLGQIFNSFIKEEPLLLS